MHAPPFQEQSLEIARRRVASAGLTNVKVNIARREKVHEREHYFRMFHFCQYSSIHKY